MTRDQSRKRQIRDRMATTGENYTTAARAITTERAATPDRRTLTAAVLTLLDQSFTAHAQGDRTAADRLISQATALDAFAVSGITGGMHIGQIPNPHDPDRWSEYLHSACAGIPADAITAAINTAPANPPTVLKDPVEEALEGLTRANYGPQQFPEQLGIPLWQFERARRDGLIPPPDLPVSGRWSARIVAQALADLGQIKRATGQLPDMGATRAAEHLSERFGVDVDPDILLELARMNLIPTAGYYKDHQLYDGRAIEQFPDRDALLLACRRGRLLTRTQVAEYLEVRPSDVAHLINAGWLEPVTHVLSGWQRRREAPAVPLFRVGDLEVLAAHPAIDWAAVRATPRGRPSPLANLTSPPKP